jgi:uncharacterized membrane protein YhaH (DUF805 family)
MRFESIFVGISRCNICVIVAFIISLVVELPDWQLTVSRWRGCGRWRWRQTS